MHGPGRRHHAALQSVPVQAVDPVVVFAVLLEGGREAAHGLDGAAADQPVRRHHKGYFHDQAVVVVALQGALHVFPAFLAETFVAPPARVQLHRAQDAPLLPVRVHELLQRIHFQPGVLVQQVGEVVALVQGDAQADVVGRAEAQVLARLDDARARPVRADQRQRAVGRAVVDQQHVGREGGFLYALQALLDPLQGVVGDDDDEDLRHGNIE